MDRYIKRFKKQENTDTDTPSTSGTMLTCPSTLSASTKPLPDDLSPTSNSPGISPLPFSRMPSRESSKIIVECPESKNTDSEDYSSSTEQTDEKQKKTKRKKIYTCNFSKQWEVEFKWCQKAENSNFLYCRICNKEISGNRFHLLRHEKNELHKKNICDKSNIVPIGEVLKKSLLKNDKLIKEGEFKLAAFVAEHDLSFNLMEHLPNLIKSVCKDSEIATGIKCIRTKTTGIINNIMGPYVLKEIVKDLNKSFYSIIIDETTDVSTKKCLAILIRYFKNNRVIDAFIGLLELENDSTAAHIFETLINYLTSIGRMKFIKPMIWSEPSCHVIDCYFCSITNTGFGKHLRWTYPNRSSNGFTLPVHRTEGIDHPTHPEVELPEEISSSSPSEYSESYIGKTPKLFDQNYLNDLACDLNLTKEKAELLASRLKQ
ncbi:unnamed protein product [Brassicogethes aeneus]|uniref:DUF4371 domain-containing protein n=1 Tax=Brassicogethes aeneus TaxID=1431903 RepID=A0A9P0B785_BRAAE|nr:unnamed protein product [Brassicogethes aeneus]